MATEENFLKQINIELADGWEAKLNSEGRIYYVDHKTQATSWLPPRDNWETDTGLPYGWEVGVDKNDKAYYINHVEKYTTREDPRNDPDYIEPPKPRDVELERDPDKGFGFVAGSEKPVVVRFVTDGGPSVDKLLAGDQIFKINGEDVRKAPREKVIELVRACKDVIVLTVCQPYSDNSSRKSALLTAAKKAKLKSNPSRVRFADSVMVNGAPVLTPSAQESYVPFMPNVLKVFLENGQTKSFKYDNKTTVKDVLQSLQEKLNIKCIHHFNDVLQSLQEKLNIKCIHHFNVVLQNMKNNTAGKMTLLQESETLADIAARPGARHFRCLFRVAYVPLDAYDLVREDAIAFEYFYLQCCNDVIHERFVPELKYDTALRLAALHIQQHATSNNMTGKISIKAIEKECGLDKFVPKSLTENMKTKDLRKMLSQYLKMNASLTAPGQKQLTALQAKLHYMKIISELKTFGSRVFMVTLLDQKTEAMVLVGPKNGVSVVTNIKSYTLTQLAEFEHISRIRVTKEGENMQRVDIDLLGEGTDPVSLGLLTEDAQNFVCMVSGYYHIFVDRDQRIVETTQGKNTSDPDVPAYGCKHRVKGVGWAYPEDLVSEVVQSGQGENGQVSEDERLIDLALPPPVYTENKEYLAQIKQELGMKPETENASMSLTLAPLQPGDSGNASLDSQFQNASIYEEVVTSFSSSPANPSSDSADSSLESSASSQQLRHSYQTLLNISSQNGIATSIHKNVPITNGHAFDSSRLEEIPSDTDSGSGADVERRPLLSSTPGGVGVVNGDLRTSFDVESDDTDSYGTPTDSPAKTRLGHNGVQSFGLMSPDLEHDQRLLVESFGLHSPDEIPAELISVLQKPSAQGQRVYFDPDIIDLTLFPPPMTPEDDNMIDFTELTVPPPTFVPKTHLPTSLNNAGATQVSAPVKSSRPVLSASPSAPSPKHRAPPPPPPVRGGQKLTKSASVGHCPDFLDNDIDDLIARFTVPPPPIEEQGSVEPLSQSWHGARPKVPTDIPIEAQIVEDEFASLIIPPPPETSSPNEEIPNIVPPVHEVPADTKRKKFRHKRSSSVDIGSLRLAEQFLATNKSKSVDVEKPNEDKHAQRRLEPPSTLGHIENGSGGSGGGLSAESPATVSEKLNNLLRSLPQVQGNWTGSLRLARSSSLDLLATNTEKFGSKAASLRVIPTTKRSTSVEAATPLSKLFVPPENSVRPVILPKSNSFDNVRIVKAQSTENVTFIVPDTSVSHSKSENTDTFASLKAKLKACKDDLIQKKNRSSFRLKKNKSESTENIDKSHGEKKGSLHRSGSFSELIQRFRHGSKEDLRKTNGSADSDSEAEKRSDGSENPLNESKKKMKMIETLAMPRSTILKPQTQITTTEKPEIIDHCDDESDQSKSKKSGPLKALSSVFTSDDKADKKGTWLKGDNPTKSKSDQPKSKKYRSKDDSIMMSGKTKEKLQTNPYATVKMWRPLSMTTSSSRDDDVYQSFTNFDHFRESLGLQKSEKSDPFQEPVKVKKTISFEDDPKKTISFDDDPKKTISFDDNPKKTISFDTTPTPDYSDTMSKDLEFSKINGTVPSEKPVSHKKAPPLPRRPSVSEESYLVVSDSVTDSIKVVQSKTYTADDFGTASNDIEKLLADLKTTMEALKSSRIDRSEKQFEMCREEVITQSKHFVNDAKLLVSSATNTKDKLALHLDKGIHTLAKIFLHSQAVMLMMHSPHQAQHLGFEVIKVSNAFKSTLNAANAAVGKPLTDPHMKYLMRQATNLASLLSTLLKTLKELKNEAYSIRL